MLVMIEKTIMAVKDELTRSFSALEMWFARDNSLLNYRPQNGGWTIAQVLEHVSLTNHYLLILIRKATSRAIDKSKKMDYRHMLVGYELNWDMLRAIREPGLFHWNRPDHMEPGGMILLTEVKTKLDAQLAECLGYLQQLSNGEGILYKTMMSVNDCGKIDVYHYIGFLAWHARRHVVQMEKIEKEFQHK